MYAIVEAQKGSYDSDIKIKKLGVKNNQPLAKEFLIGLLVDEYISRIDHSDINVSYTITEDDFIFEAKKVLLEEINKQNDRLLYNNGEDYIKLHYNRLKNLTGYTIPCSSLNEYQGKTVSVISVQ